MTDFVTRVALAAAILATLAGQPFLPGSEHGSPQDEPETKTPSDRARDFPPRAKAALGGRAIFATLADLSLAEREARILAEIDAGNIPSHLRKTKTVELRDPAKPRKRGRVRMEVLPDYLAIGSDEDFVRVPLTPMSAQRVADRYGYILPTTKLVDAIHAAAKVQLTPRPLTKSRDSTATFVQHDDLIAAQLAKRRRSKGCLVSGIKKDIVITPRLKKHPHRVAIYGWHRATDDPIQPLYVGHTDTYVDYSHGVRLVRRTVKIDGKDAGLGDVLSDPTLHTLVSDEGPIPREQQEYGR